MGRHSIAELKNKLSELVQCAENGEEIVITRHGKAVAKLVGVETKPAPKPMTPADLGWLRKRRVGKMPKEDAGTLVSRMRDEDWQR
ncbi:MAG: type II toxin-antitoxin system prevent-host-death family antitoxin [Proteobacteria bacterium]|nr:type II toxin-antitoxin system prevent-host-death family antitoxin [Pseudomonadota bacterium]